ncbi:hypothetical protein JXB41_00325 [Candidatus Woesearchaeota archaeon]|nr:hypothetical protein [Candidatus Woesearchaeota archaeon]
MIVFNESLLIIISGIIGVVIVFVFFIVEKYLIKKRQVKMTSADYGLMSAELKTFKRSAAKKKAAAKIKKTTPSETPEIIHKDPFHTFLAIGIAIFAFIILIFSVIELFQGKEYSAHLLLGLSLIANAMLVYKGKPPTTTPSP